MRNLVDLVLGTKAMKTGGHRMILFVLAHTAQDHGRSFISEKEIHNSTGMSRKAVCAILGDLEREGWLDRTKIFFVLSRSKLEMEQRSRIAELQTFLAKNPAPQTRAEVAAPNRF